MDLPAGIVPGLALLTAALDDPDIDIARSVQQVATAVVTAVPGFVGLSLHIGRPGQQIVVVAMDGITAGDKVEASLRIALFGESVIGGVALVLYGSTPGAFVDLHADLSWVIGRPASGLTLDQDLVMPAESVDRLADLSMVNQAIGVLIAGGYTPEQAVAALDQLAASGAVRSHAVARSLLYALDEERRSR